MKRTFLFWPLTTVAVLGFPFLSEAEMIHSTGPTLVRSNSPFGIGLSIMALLLILNVFAVVASRVRQKEKGTDAGLAA